MKYALSVLVFPLLVAGSSYQQSNAARKPRPHLPKKVLPAQQSGANEQVMQRAWYEYSTDGGTPPTASTGSFTMLANTSRKTVNFVSEMEQYYRQQAIILDTSYMHLIGPWRGLTVSQKYAIVTRKQKVYSRRADSLHAVNNQGHALIWLVNNSAAPVVLGTQDGSVFCVLQALDRNQQWRPVQYWQYSGCGNSYIARYLRPEEHLSLLAKIPCQGDFKTKLRYKLAGIKRFYYSNEFEGRIGYSEFSEPPGRYGRSATGQLVAPFKLDSLPRPFYGGKRAFPFHQGGKWGDSLPY